MGHPPAGKRYLVNSSGSHGYWAPTTGAPGSLVPLVRVRSLARVMATIVKAAQA